MTLRGRVFVALALAAGLCGAVAPARAQAIRETRLANGLRLVMAPDTTAPVADVSVWYRAGTRFEPAGRSGISNLLLRTLIASGPSVKEQSRLSELGAQSSTMLAPDMMCFWSTVPPAAVPAALRVEAQRMGGTRIPAAALAAARRGADDEARRRPASPAFTLGLERLFATAFAGTPYAAPAAGLERERSTVTLEALQAYADRRVVPDGTVLAVTGRFDPDSVARWAARWFGALPSRRGAEPAPIAFSARTAPAHGTLLADTQVPLLFVGWRGPGAVDSARVVLRVLARLLGEGPGSVLDVGLVRNMDPLAIGVQGDLDLRREASLIYAVVLVRPGMDSLVVQTRVLAQASRLGQEPLMSEVVEAARVRVEADLRMAAQGPRGSAATIGGSALLCDDPGAAAADLDRLARVTPQQVRDAALRVLQPESASLVWVWPPSGPPPVLPAEEK